MRGTAVVIASLLLASCNARDDFPAWPPFTMTVPADLPNEMTLTNKDGTTQRGNGKELWIGGYRAGWKQCVQEFERGELELTAERVEAPPIQTFGIVYRGWDAGYRTCWQAIRAERSGCPSPRRRKRADQGNSIALDAPRSPR